MIDALKSGTILFAINWQICFCIVREIVYFYVILIKENVQYDVKPQAFSDCFFYDLYMKIHKCQILWLTHHFILAYYTCESSYNWSRLVLLFYICNSYSLSICLLYKYTILLTNLKTVDVNLKIKTDHCLRFF